MCADGFKCAAYASDDGNAWDATKCTKVTGEGKPGGGCVVEDSPTSGIDSCEPGAMCWGVEPDMTGTCYALCTGSPENAVCPPGSSCFQTNEGVVNVCVIDCDPLEADCTPGHVCVPDPMTLQFVCLPPANNLEVGSPCGFTNDCAPGLVCWDPSLMPSTCADAEGCCLQYCDTAKQECPDTQECMPFFVKDTAPPGLETLGLCAEAP